MRQNESKETAAAPSLYEKVEKSSCSLASGGKNAPALSAPSDELKLNQTTSVQEEEPLVSAALNMDISTGT